MKHVHEFQYGTRTPAEIEEGAIAAVVCPACGLRIVTTGKLTGADMKWAHEVAKRYFVTPEDV